LAVETRHALKCNQNKTEKFRGGEETHQQLIARIWLINILNTPKDDVNIQRHVKRMPKNSTAVNYGLETKLKRQIEKIWSLKCRTFLHFNASTDFARLINFSQNLHRYRFSFLPRLFINFYKIYANKRQAGRCAVAVDLHMTFLTLESKLPWGHLVNHQSHALHQQHRFSKKPQHIYKTLLYSFPLNLMKCKWRSTGMMRLSRLWKANNWKSGQQSALALLLLIGFDGRKVHCLTLRLRLVSLYLDFFCNFPIGNAIFIIEFECPRFGAVPWQSNLIEMGSLISFFQRAKCTTPCV